jgi:hypothetical protein
MVPQVTRHTTTSTERMMARAALIFCICAAAAAACRPPIGAGTTAAPAVHEGARLPTGAFLDPAAPSVALGSMPLAMALSPEGDHLVVLLNGWREQGLQVVELRTGRVTQLIEQPAAFLGLAFAPDGKALYVSGGNQDVVYHYGWSDGHASLIDSICLAPLSSGANGAGTRAVSRSPPMDARSTWPRTWPTLWP